MGGDPGQGMTVLHRRGCATDEGRSGDVIWFWSGRRMLGLRFYSIGDAGE
jgi:hypothetical protein